MRRMNVDLPQPESAARPMTTGLEASIETAERDGATRGAAARPGAHDDAVIWVKASMAKGRGESVSEQTRGSR